MVNQDGSVNVLRMGVPQFQVIDVFHHLITMSWWRFNLLVVAAYIGINLVFTITYALIGYDHLGGMTSSTPVGKFVETFFFSTQPLTPVGSGRLNPMGMAVNIVASLEMMAGLLTFALATGLLYGRFSRPTAKIIFSDHALIAPYKDFTGWMFRIANARSNQLTELEAQVTLGYNNEENGVIRRRFAQLKLELAKINFLALSWTLVHPIDEDSPLYGLTEADFKSLDPEFLIQIKAIDDSYNQTVYARSSYKDGELVWGARFISAIGETEDRKTFVDLRKISSFEKLD